MKTSQTSLHRSDSFARSQTVPRLRGHFFFAVLAALTLLGLTDRVAAQGTVPERMSFQGFLEDANGVPFGESAPVILNVKFRIFPTPTGGTVSWAESQNVTFDKGRYSVLLGSGSSVDNEPRGSLSAVVANNPGNRLFVETTVTLESGAETTITPRLRLVASPFALLATHALSADSAEEAVTLTGTLPVSQLSGSLLESQLRNGAVTTDKIANGAVTEGKILNDAVVSAKIKDNAVYAAKIANGSIIEAKIAPGAVTEGKIANGAVRSVKIESLDANKLTGTLPAARLPASAARRDAANTFTVNQTINGDLTVRDEVRVGSSQYKVVAGSESLRMVRGVVGLAPDNTPVGVVGAPTYVVGHHPNNSLLFRILFTPPFSSTPAVTVCPINNKPAFGGDIVDAYAQIIELDAGHVDINFLQPLAGGGRQLPFSFIAVGSR